MKNQEHMLPANTRPQQKDWFRYFTIAMAFYSGIRTLAFIVGYICGKFDKYFL